MKLDVSAKQNPAALSGTAPEFFLNTLELTPIPRTSTSIKLGDLIIAVTHILKVTQATQYWT